MKREPWFAAYEQCGSPANARASLDRRMEIADKLDEIPTACWTDLVDWAYGSEKADDEPSVTGGAYCALSPELVEVGSCYCGKFRAGLALTAARDPIDADAEETPDEYDDAHPEDPDTARDREIADQMGAL